MIDHPINKGLTFSLKTLDTLTMGNAFITKDDDNNVTITLFYSGFECPITSTDSRIAYEIRFYFPSHYLDSYFSQHAEDLHYQFNAKEENELCCTKQMILHEIINCKFRGAYYNMFLESKALALLLCFQGCKIKPLNDCGACKFLVRAAEKDKIYRAKEIILSRLNNPLTIPELSLEIGINQCYLKRGFKEIFGVTVYDFVQEERMKKAKYLLTTTNLSVSQIAYQIGFSSISNFSSSFKKHTGVLPSEFQNANA